MPQILSGIVNLNQDDRISSTIAITITIVSQ